MGLDERREMVSGEREKMGSGERGKWGWAREENGVGREKKNGIGREQKMGLVGRRKWGWVIEENRVREEKGFLVGLRLLLHTATPPQHYPTTTCIQLLHRYTATPLQYAAPACWSGSPPLRRCR